MNCWLMGFIAPRRRARGLPRRRHCGPSHDTITLSEARSRLDRSRFSRPRPHFLAFFKIYKKITFSRANSGNFCQKIGKICQNFDIFLQILQNFQKSAKFLQNFAEFFCRILQNLVDFEKCWKMLYWMQKFMEILLKFNEILTKFWQNSDKILTKVRFQKRVHGKKVFRSVCSKTEVLRSINHCVVRSHPATTHHSFGGSFSAGSKPIFASKYAFFSIFQNLQENHLFASKFCKFLQKN